MIRGFAEAWRIEGADVISIQEIFDALHHYEYIFKYKYSRREHTAPYAPEYIFPGEMGNEIREFWVVKNLEDVFNRFGSSNYTDELTMRLYLQDNQGLVENLANRYPSLDFYECFCGSWDSLMQEMKNVYPQIELPEMTRENWAGIYCDWLYGRTIRVRMNKSLEDYGWTTDHKQYLLELIEEYCGKIPKKTVILFWGYKPAIKES